MMQPKALAAALAMLGLLAVPVTANELADAATELCDKIKQCTMAQINEADMTPEMRQMMEPMINSMCDSMRAGIEEVPTDHELYPGALACMESMSALSCTDFQDGDKVQTPECKAYQAKAEAAYGQ